MVSNRYDLIVVGGGHAGIEAALASARLSMKTLLLTMNKAQIGEMSCNPSVGGVGKGHIVREIDALGGEIGKVTDMTGIQFRRLNSSKGGAVQGFRAQVDRIRYKLKMQEIISAEANIVVMERMVKELILEKEKVVAVLTDKEDLIYCKALVIATGTFLNGLIHIGERKIAGGRRDESGSFGLTENLVRLGFRKYRFKTGTCPRIDSRSIDYSKMEEQKGDEPPPKFSFYGDFVPKNQASCYLTFTNDQTDSIIRESLDRSPLFSGEIKGVGPRYCPSIEDKVKKFPDKKSHHVFLEPESFSLFDSYPNGLSTSLPFDIQKRFLQSIRGFENCEILKPGYAIEYDIFDPRDLKPTLESSIIENLYFAGQINGSSGYEEAAGQGLIAGINSSLKILGKSPLILGRESSYIGVMIDDLTKKGVEEPYRIFTSRGEFRLVLRQGNADLRLSERGYRIGLLKESDYRKFVARRSKIESELDYLERNRLSLSLLSADLRERVSGESVENISYKDLLKRSNISLSELSFYRGFDLPSDILSELELNIRYEGYLKRDERLREKLLKSKGIRIPSDIDYGNLKGLSKEAIDKLSRFRPSTLGEAEQISGITPAALLILQLNLKCFT